LEENSIYKIQIPAPEKSRDFLFYGTDRWDYYAMPAKRRFPLKPVIPLAIGPERKDADRKPPRLIGAELDGC